MYCVVPIRPAAASLLAAYIHLSINEKRSYVMTSFATVYRRIYCHKFMMLSRRRVAFASALEYPL